MYNSYQYNPWQAPMPPVKKSINWGNILNNTQKTLGIINQAIPIVYQVRPLVSNAKTLFRIAGALHDDEPQIQESKPMGQQTTIKKDSQTPQFFL